MFGLDIVVPDGSMQSCIEGLFRDAGFAITIPDVRTSEGIVASRMVNLLQFQRPQEIPDLLYKGCFNVGLTGRDCLVECELENNLRVLADFPIGRAGDAAPRIVVAVKDSLVMHCSRPTDLRPGAVVATEYPRLARRYFAGLGRQDVKIELSVGKTEQKIRYGADAIVELVETGHSLHANGLCEIGTILTSDLLIVAPETGLVSSDYEDTLACFVKLIQGVVRARQLVRIEANVPHNRRKLATEILGGLKSPTVAQLADKSWFCLTSYVPVKQEHEVIAKLLAIDVTDIAVTRDTPLLMA